MTTVYLSGGIRREWRNSVKERFKDVDFIDPMETYTPYASVYAWRNLQSITDCDIVFAFIEPTNHSGIGLSFELGYALALGKHTIFIDQSGTNRFEYPANAVASYVVGDFEEAMAILEYAIEVL